MGGVGEGEAEEIGGGGGGVEEEVDGTVAAGEDGGRERCGRMQVGGIFGDGGGGGDEGCPDCEEGAESEGIGLGGEVQFDLLRYFVSYSA